MTVVIPKKKALEMKELIEEGLHIFGRAMSMCEEMCEGGDLGERQGNGGYGERGGYGMREDYPMGERGGYMGERRGRSASTGRYTRM